MPVYRLPTIEPTKPQEKWIKKQKKKTKKTYADIMRGLIQEKIDEE